MAALYSQLPLTSSRGRWLLFSCLVSFQMLQFAGAELRVGLESAGGINVLAGLLERARALLGDSQIEQAGEAVWRKC